MEISGLPYPSSAAVSFSPTAGRNHGRKPQIGLSDLESDSTQSPFDKAPQEPIKIGFGKDSVKIPNLTVSTIKRNVRQAAALVPTPEESEARVRQRVRDDERRIGEQIAQAPRMLDLRTSRESAVNAARSYLSSVNTAAGQALALTDPVRHTDTNRLDIRVGNINVPYDKPKTAPTFDLLA